MRKILTFEDAHQVLSPIYDTLAECIQISFAEHISMASYANSFGRLVSYKNRTKANIVHDHLRSHVEERFGIDNRCIVDEWNNIFGLKVEDQIFIRFNKIDENRKMSCRKTQQHVDYMRQGEIAGFPAAPTLVYAGYLPNPTWTTINGIYLVCPTSEKLIHWSYELDRKNSNEQLSIFERNEGRTKRVRLKNEEIYRQLKIKKFGTDDTHEV